MGWKQERDSLIAQTLAFVQSVAGKTEVPVPPPSVAVDLDELEASRRRSAPPPIEPPSAAATVQPVVKQVTPVERPKPAEPPASALAQRPIVQSEVAEEIRARVASFRAHQERFNREREEYFRTTLARLKAATKDSPSSRLEK